MPNRTERPAPSRRQPLCVLMAEHNLEDVELVKRALEVGGFDLRLDIVAERAEFESRLQETEYDVVLADFRLPNWTGMDAFALLRESGRDTPLILVTGTMGDESAVDCIKQGVADYVLKDRLAQLPVAVRRALEEKSFRDAHAFMLEMLQQSEEGFRLLFASNPLPMWVYDRETLAFLQVNDAAVAKYGYSRLDFFGMKITDIRPAEDLPRLMDYLGNPHETVLSSGEWRHRLRDGTVIDVEIDSHAIDYGGRQAVLVVMKDVTSRKRAEEENLRLVTAIEQSAEGVVITDPNGVMEYVNPAFTKMTGYARAEAVGQSVRILKSGKQDDEFYRRLWDTILAGWTWRGEMINRRKDGSRYAQESNITPVRNDAGAITHFIAIQQDVTERRALEEQLRQGQKFEAIGQLAGGIAHDFNNVIGAILGWAELGQDETPQGSTPHGYFRKIADQSNRAAALIRQLLTFARRQALEPTGIQLNEIIPDLLNLLDNVLGKGIELKTVLAPDLCMVRASPPQIEQVLMNLCVNARDAMPQGGRLVIATANAELSPEACRRFPEAQPGSYVSLSVSDTGVGIDASIREHIFEPFFTTKEVGKGTGLGLATVYGIVKQHGGVVDVESELGAGATFRVYLPVTEALAETKTKGGQRRAEPAQEGSETILVADDHDGVRAMAVQSLERLGYRVLLATDGEEAVQVAERHGDSIALVVLDMVMPRLSGPEAYRRISALRPGLPAVFATGYSAEMAAVEGLGENRLVVLQKPYTPAQLAGAVRQVLDAAPRLQENAASRDKH